MRMRSTNVSGRESARLSVSSSRQVDKKGPNRTLDAHYPSSSPADGSAPSTIITAACGHLTHCALCFSSPAIALLCVFFAHAAQAKDQTAAETATLPAKVHHQLLARAALRQPHRPGQPGLDRRGRLGDCSTSGWALPASTSSAGKIASTRSEHLGLPQNFQPSRATSIRLAQTLDADYIIVGFYTLQNEQSARLRRAARRERAAAQSSLWSRTAHWTTCSMCWIRSPGM